MPGYLAGALGLTSRHSLNITAWLSHHVLLAVLVAIGIIVAFLLMLAIPVMSTASYYRFSSSFRRSALPTFLVGFGVLIVGLASSVRIIELAGGGIMATVVIGLIIDQYLTPHPDTAPRHRTRHRTHVS